MLCHLPLPYADELLYSIIARYLIRIGAASSVSTIDHIFGGLITAQVYLPGSLDVVSERTWPIWQMTATDIADRLTLFPYYSRYLSPKITERALKILLSKGNRSPHMQLGVIFQRVKVPRFLRFCRACRQSDLSEHGETYWRRIHQLAGVLVCPEHGQPLLDSIAPMRPTKRFAFADATVNTLDVSSREECILNEIDAAMALRIAIRLQEMLSGAIQPWDTEDLRMAYRNAALERGYATSTNSLDLSLLKLKSDFVSFYGDFLLSKLTCSVELKHVQYTWLNQMFWIGRHHTSSHPLEHALVQLFLESIPINPSKRLLFESGPWRCPNPYAKHEDQFPIERLKGVFRGRNGDLTASARCRCGFTFTFSKTADADPKLPIIKRIIAHGPTWETEVERLRQNGLSIWAITQKMKINYHTYLRLLSKTQNSHYVSQEQLIQWRQEWLKVLNKVPGRFRYIAKTINPKLYRKLMEYDRDWLYNASSAKRCVHTPKMRVDWASRDPEWANILRSAYSRIIQAIPTKRATITAIIHEANLCVELLKKKSHLLPISSSVLTECAESIENYHERCQQNTALKTGS
ncbi:MAG: TnsD family Tn7-like transposition protein [Dissulfurispiraceae bacterium]